MRWTRLHIPSKAATAISLVTSGLGFTTTQSTPPVPLPLTIAVIAGEALFRVGCSEGMHPDVGVDAHALALEAFVDVDAGDRWPQLLHQPLHPHLAPRPRPRPPGRRAWPQGDDPPLVNGASSRPADLIVDGGRSRASAFELPAGASAAGGLERNGRCAI
eukprot:scaffold5678_cov394-Prasinococcus_capsulatus_cf.AAC.4